MNDEFLFKIVTKQGHTYKLFLSGRTEGFPKDAVVTNRAIPFFNKLSALTNRPDIEARSGANQERKIVA